MIGEAQEEDITVTDESEPSGGEESRLDPRCPQRRTAEKARGPGRQGIDPYPFRFDRTAIAAELHERHDELEPDVRTGEMVAMAGRLTSCAATASSPSPPCRT